MDEEQDPFSLEGRLVGDKDYLDRAGVHQQLRDTLEAAVEALDGLLALEPSQRDYHATGKRVERSIAEALEVIRSDDIGDDPGGLPRELMHHEIRNPLNSATGYAQLLAMEGLEAMPGKVVHHGEDKRERFATTARDATRDALEVLDYAGQFPSLASGSYKPRYRYHTADDIHRVLDRTYSYADGFKQTHGKNDIMVRYDAVKPGQESLMTDLVVVRHVMMNLLSNAIKYGEREVRMYSPCLEDGEIRFQIWNDGGELTRHQRANLFQPGYRASSEHAEQSKGLGLAVVKGLVDGIRGSITVTPENGGNLFTARMPYQPSGLQQG